MIAISYTVEMITDKLLQVCKGVHNMKSAIWKKNMKKQIKSEKLTGRKGSAALTE